jgi:hypothetical protein
MCPIFAQSGVELLISIHRGNQFWKWQAWMLILGLVGFALLQLWYLYKARQTCGLHHCLSLPSSVDCEWSYLFLPSFALTYHSSPSRHFGYFHKAVNVDTFGGDEVDVPLSKMGLLTRVPFPNPTPGPPVLQ